MICHGCRSDSPSGLRCDCETLWCPACYERHVCPSSLAPLWAHQDYGVSRFFQALDAGEKEICLTTPTGGGKTRLASEIARRMVERELRVMLFTDRKLLTRNGSENFAKFGIDHGVIAAGYPMDLMRRVQVASIQTVQSWVFRRKKLELPPFDLAIFDEAHKRTFDGVIEACRARGTPYLGLTATPVGVGDNYKTLIVAGTNSSLRDCKALVPCDVFAPSEPDMKGVRMEKGEYVYKDMVKRVMQCIVFADVFNHWKRLNPFAEPTLLFAPGIPESRWFVQEFERMGVRAAHIDGETPDAERLDIIEGSRRRDIKVVCSFGVLREGVDLPWIHYGVLVQVCGSLKTYLQIVGRLLRAHPGKARACLQDHAGAWHRHGSPNQDRAWDLSCTDKTLADARKKARERGDEAEPICCPKCNAIRSAGPKCPRCGYEHTKSVRMVRTVTGELRRMVGPTVKKKKEVSEDQKVWKSCLFAGAARRMTVKQAMGWFRQQTGHAVPDSVEPPPPPAGSLDLDRACGTVWPWLFRRKKKVTT